MKVWAVRNRSLAGQLVIAPDAEHAIDQLWAKRFARRRENLKAFDYMPIMGDRLGVAELLASGRTGRIVARAEGPMVTTKEAIAALASGEPVRQMPMRWHFLEDVKRVQAEE